MSYLSWAVFQSRQWKPVGCIIWMKTEPCLWVFRIWNYLQDIWNLFISALLWGGHTHSLNHTSITLSLSPVFRHPCWQQQTDQNAGGHQSLRYHHECSQGRGPMHCNHCQGTEPWKAFSSSEVLVRWNPVGLFCSHWIQRAEVNLKGCSRDSWRANKCWNFSWRYVTSEKLMIWCWSCRMSPQTDPSIIGGMVVEVGDKYIDMTTATKIKKIMQTLRVAL